MNHDQKVVALATRTYLKDTREMNRRISTALNAGHRKVLLEQKNQIIERYQTETGLCDAKPADIPDLPVFDLRAMDDEITREAELEKLAEVQPPQFSLKSKLGLVVAMVMFSITITIVVFQVLDYQKQVLPAIDSQDGRRAQIKAILAGVGDQEAIQATTDPQQLTAKLADLRKAVEALAKGGTDEELEDLVNRRRELIKTQILKLRREQ